MLTTDEIIRRCVQTHKNIYDYSKVEYKGDKHKIEIICPKHGSFFQNAYFHYGKLKCKCPKCVGRNLSNYEIIKELTELNGYNYSLIDEKIDFKKSYSIICPQHGLFHNTIDNLKNKQQQCPLCNPKGRKKLTIKNIQQKIKEKIGNVFEYEWETYIDYYKPMVMICPKHGKFNQTIANHLFGQRCPNCKNSLGEEKIRIFLKKNNIQFIPQYKFEKCKNKTYLPFDFYLPLYNLCIEYDGELHYKEVKLFGGKEGLENRKQLDKIKTNFCLANNITLLRIPYYEYNNIEKTLTQWITQNMF